MHLLVLYFARNVQHTVLYFSTALFIGLHPQEYMILDTQI